MTSVDIFVESLCLSEVSLMLQIWDVVGRWKSSLLTRVSFFLGPLQDPFTSEFENRWLHMDLTVCTEI